MRMIAPDTATPQILEQGQCCLGEAAPAMADGTSKRDGIGHRRSARRPPCPSGAQVQDLAMLTRLAAKQPIVAYTAPCSVALRMSSSACSLLSSLSRLARQRAVRKPGWLFRRDVGHFIASLDDGRPTSTP